LDDCDWRASNLRVDGPDSGIQAGSHGMTVRFLFLAIAATGLAAMPGHTQVIEIDSNGSARTYAGPTVFTGSGSASIGTHVRRTVNRGVTVDLVTDMARAQGLDPALLQAVAWQESRGRTNAVSVKGALGVMQLMPGTAAELNVDAGDVVDNIRGGAIYLRRQLDRFGGNVPLALAAYNAGPGAVSKFGGIPPFRETQNYVATILGRWRSLPAGSGPVPLAIEVAQ
jgi:Transglycosylase SLT domain